MSKQCRLRKFTEKFVFACAGKSTQELGTGLFRCLKIIPEAYFRGVYSSKEPAGFINEPLEVFVATSLRVQTRLHNNIIIIIDKFYFQAELLNDHLKNTWFSSNLNKDMLGI